MFSGIPAFPSLRSDANKAGGGYLAFTGKLIAIPHQSAETSSVIGRQQLVRFALRDGDPFNIIRLLETLDLRTRESADLVFAFEMLRSRNFPVDDLTAWTKHASTYLGRVLDDGFTRLAS